MRRRLRTLGMATMLSLVGPAFARGECTGQQVVSVEACVAQECHTKNDTALTRCRRNCEKSRDIALRRCGQTDGAANDGSGTGDGKAGRHQGRGRQHAQR